MQSLLNITGQLLSWDKALFEFINGWLANPFFDTVMPWLRNSAIWAPLYLFLFFLVVLNFPKRSPWWILFFICTVALTDLTGTYIFKHNVHRLRPCSDPDFYTHVRLVLNQCAGGYSFISNHAANHFGMAAFFYITMRPVIPRYAWTGFLWAFLIIFAQVYVGVHYPSDVLAGALLGLAFGSFSGRLFNRQFRLDRPW